MLRQDDSHLIDTTESRECEHRFEKGREDGHSDIEAVGLFNALKELASIRDVFLTEDKAVNIAYYEGYKAACWEYVKG